MGEKEKGDHQYCLPRDPTVIYYLWLQVYPCMWSIRGCVNFRVWVMTECEPASASDRETVTAFKGNSSSPRKGGDGCQEPNLPSAPAANGELHFLQELCCQKGDKNASGKRNSDLLDGGGEAQVCPCGKLKNA